MKKIPGFLLFILLCLVSEANNKLPQVGLASYYGDRANHHRVACGERYCKDSFTAAHRTLPFGTYLKVTNLKNHKTVIVRVNDRGPYGRHRIIDLSGAAATRLGMRAAGLARVRIRRATAEEIRLQQVEINDSIRRFDTLSANRVLHVADPVAKIYMVRGGTFRLKKTALGVKSYLNKKGINHVSVKKVRARKHFFFKVMIGPVDEAGKKRVLKILRNKKIKGMVIRL
jgi:rare lipoprotein A